MRSLLAGYYKLADVARHPKQCGWCLTNSTRMILRSSGLRLRKTFIFEYIHRTDILFKTLIFLKLSSMLNFNMSSWPTDRTSGENVSSPSPDTITNVEPLQLDDSDIPTDDEKTKEASCEEKAILKLVCQDLIRPHPSF